MLENIIYRIWFVIDILVVRDILLEWAIVIILLVYILRTIKDINIRLNKKQNRSYYLDNFFYKFLKLQFIFIVVFLINAMLILGILDHSIMECLITKFILSLGFFSWTSIIYIIELVFTKRYLENYNNTQNVDNIWNWVKLGITLVFFSIFVWLLFCDMSYLIY